MATATKPTFIGLLNAIAVAETAAEGYLTDWAATTKDKKLASTLRFVAMREGEHGKAFAKRLLELGYEVRWPEDQEPSKSAEVAVSDKSDLQKFRALNVGKPVGKPDVFDGMFADKSIDPITGGLLGRYIAEERDSGRRLNAEYERLAKKDEKAKARKKAGAKS